MADTTACPGVFATLEEIADVVTLPAEQGVLLDQIHRFDAYFASLQVRADREVLDRASCLRAISTPSTGTDHIDLVSAREKSIAVFSLKEDTAFLNKLTATAELAWALVLATVRRLPWACEAAKKGDWARDGFRGHQISGRTLGILGYGRLGRMVAEYGKAFRMRVLACNDSAVIAAPGVQLVDFDTLIRESDVISIHIHLTEKNRNLLSRDVLGRMKRGSIIINTSRGAIIDEHAMLDRLRDGSLAGAGLDVIDGEWEPKIAQHPLLEYARTHQNMVITPHIGGVTYESQRMAFARAVEKLRDFFVEGQGSRNATAPR